MDYQWGDDLPGDSSSHAQSDPYADHAIRVEEHGVECGTDRFPEGNVPRLATWRNNLTALSQRHNLYFIAYWEKIYVYQPSQDQSIGATPALILTPRVPETEIESQGHIAPDAPHGINHIVMGDLGNEEILALTTDTGTVAAYRTERIFSVIDSCDDLEENDPTVLGKQVQCFFSESVVQSAWGLAIHKHARLIAVGSNTSILTVFAFALVDESETQRQEAHGTGGFSPSEWYRVDDVFAFAKVRNWSRERRRAQNVQLCFTEHYTNIPNVSFLSNELDPHGDWLVSTDINNKLLIWKIWEGPRPVSHWRFHPPTHSHYADDIFDDRQRGWNVLALDPRAFRIKNNPTEACGGPPHRYPNNRAPYDLSFLAGRIPNATQYYDFFSTHGPPPAEYERGEGAPSDESFSVSSFAISEGEPELLDEGQSWQAEARVQVTNESENEALGSAPEAADLDPLPGYTTNTDGYDYDPEMQQSESSEEVADNSEQGTFLPQPQPLDPDSEDSSDDENMGNMPPEIVPHLDEDGILPVYYSAPHNRTENQSIFSDFPIIHFSETHIRLLPGPFASGPSVIFRAALSQVLTARSPAIEACDRMNMALQIPELGIVIAASQKGRVAIISLTEVPRKGKMFRIDRILPFESQERRRLRPLVPLLGIAAGPVEGHLLPPEAENDRKDNSSPEPSSVFDEIYDEEEEDPQDTAGESHKRNLPFESMRGGFKREQWHGTEYSRRYRLYLTYYDNTILKYELYYDWPEIFRGSSAIDRPLIIRT